MPFLIVNGELGINGVRGKSQNPSRVLSKDRKRLFGLWVKIKTPWLYVITKL
jgi:hypothetical protein